MIRSERAAQMAGSVAAAARARGFAERDVDAVSRVLDSAMLPRLEGLPDDHDPSFLHPGRTAMVLLNDVGQVDTSVLVVGMLHESCDVELRVTSARLAELVGPSGVAAIESIPLPGDENVIERLVALGPGVSLAALAERLDHLRHLHLRADRMDSWADIHDEVLRAWLPFAQRVHPLLTRRYAHWVRTFAARIGA